MPNNASIYNGVIAGATGGVHERWITSQQSSDYIAIRNAIIEFASEVDALIPSDTAIGASNGSLIQSITQGVLAQRYINTDTAFGDLARAIVALYTEIQAQLEPVTAEFPDRTSADTDGSTTTTGTAFVDAQTLGSFPTEAGTYQLEWYCEVQQPIGGLGPAQVRANLDGVVVALSQQQPTNAGEFWAVSGWALRVLAAGDHTATLQFRSDGVSVATIRRRRLSIVRVS